MWTSHKFNCDNIFVIGIYSVWARLFCGAWHLRTCPITPAYDVKCSWCLYQDSLAAVAFEPLCSSSFACSGTFFFFLLNLHLKEAHSSPLMAASGSSTTKVSGLRLLVQIKHLLERSRCWGDEGHTEPQHASQLSPFLFLVLYYLPVVLLVVVLALALAWFHNSLYVSSIQSASCGGYIVCQY